MVRSTTYMSFKWTKPAGKLRVQRNQKRPRSMRLRILHIFMGIARAKRILALSAKRRVMRSTVKASEPDIHLKILLKLFNYNLYIKNSLMNIK